jgi:hypothetical protein
MAGGGAGDDVADLEAHTGERDHADDDAHRGRRCAHGERVLRTGFERLHQHGRLDTAANLQRAHQDDGDHHADGKDAELDVFVKVGEGNGHQRHVQCPHQHPVVRAVAANRGGQANDGARGDADERGQIRRAPTDKNANQQKQGDQRGPAHFHALAQLRHFFLGQTAQAVALGFEMHLHEHAEEVHEGRHDGRGDDGLVGQAQKLDHQERCGAQNRRRDLPAGGGRRLDRPGKVPLVADPDHGRNGERSDRHRIGHRRTRQHAEHGRTKHADLCRAARVATGNAGGDIQKQLPQTDARGHHAKQHEVKHVRGHHPDRHAIDALAGEVLMVDELRPACARVLEQAGKVGTKERVGGEAQGNQRQRPAHAAPRGFQQGDKQHGAAHHVPRVGVAHTKGQFFEGVRDVEHGEGHADAQHPVVQRNTARRGQAVANRAVLRGLAARKHQKDQAQHERQVHAAMRGLSQQAEAGCVEVKAAQRDQQPLDDEGRRRHRGAKAHLGVEFFFQGQQLLVIRQCGGGEGVHGVLRVAWLQTTTGGNNSARQTGASGAPAYFSTPASL